MDNYRGPFQKASLCLWHKPRKLSSILSKFLPSHTQLPHHLPFKSHTIVTGCDEGQPRNAKTKNKIQSQKHVMIRQFVSQLGSQVNLLFRQFYFLFVFFVFQILLQWFIYYSSTIWAHNKKLPLICLSGASPFSVLPRLPSFGFCGVVWWSDKS